MELSIWIFCANTVLYLLKGILWPKKEVYNDFQSWYNSLIMNTDKVNPNVPGKIEHIFKSETHLKFILLQIGTKCHFDHIEVIWSNK